MLSGVRFLTAGVGEASIRCSQQRGASSHQKTRRCSWSAPKPRPQLGDRTPVFGELETPSHAKRCCAPKTHILVSCCSLATSKSRALSVRALASQFGQLRSCQASACTPSRTNTPLDAPSAHCLPPSSAIPPLSRPAAHLDIRRPPLRRP